MALGFDKPKTVPCAVSGKNHKWEFVRNGMRKQQTGGPLGSTVRLTTVGIYRCACSKQRYGSVRHNEPGADVRDYEQKAEE